MSSTVMTVLGVLNAALIQAIGFGDLNAVFGAWEPVARFVMTVGAGGLAAAVGKSHPGKG